MLSAIFNDDIIQIQNLIKMNAKIVNQKIFCNLYSFYQTKNNSVSITSSATSKDISLQKVHLQDDENEHDEKTPSIYAIYPFKNSYFSYPIHIAIQRANKSIIEYLLVNNANYNLRDEFGKLPMELAIMSDRSYGIYILVYQ